MRSSGCRTHFLMFLLLFIAACLAAQSSGEQPSFLYIKFSREPHVADAPLLYAWGKSDHGRLWTGSTLKASGRCEG